MGEGGVVHGREGGVAQGREVFSTGGGRCCPGGGRCCPWEGGRCSPGEGGREGGVVHRRREVLSRGWKGGREVLSGGREGGVVQGGVVLELNRMSDTCL